MDEAFLTLHKQRPYLWRAVDQDGNGRDILGQRRRNKAAANTRLGPITYRATRSNILTTRLREAFLL
jgi:transposase-like protein